MFSMSSLELGSELLGVETAAEERACQDMCLLLEGCTVYRWHIHEYMGRSLMFYINSALSSAGGMRMPRPSSPTPASCSPTASPTTT